MAETERKQQSSYVTIFAMWNCCVGGGLVSHPWGFSESGALLSLFINFTVMMISFYTCHLVMKCGKGDEDFLVTLHRYFGKKGAYASIITTIMILYLGAIIYYQLLTQTLYPIIIGIKDTIAGTYTPSVSTEVDFSSFSLTWTSIIIFIPLYLIVCMKDRSIFIKISSIGVIFIVIQILFVICIFIMSLTNTDYDLTLVREHTEGKNIAMFHKNFQSLTGMLAAGYYVHQLGLPIILDNKDQTKNTRDTFMAYFFVFLTYWVIGIWGYFGFSGVYFQNIPIRQNLLNMFSMNHGLATIVRVWSFIQIFSVYPLLFHIVRVNFFRAFEHWNFEGAGFYIYNLVASLPWLVLAIWYPRVGDLLSYAGGVFGVMSIYILPVVVYLKIQWLKATNPERLAELKGEKMDKFESISDSNQNLIDWGITNEELKEKLLDQEISKDQNKVSQTRNLGPMKRIPISHFYLMLWINSLVLCFGLAIFILQFISF